jgi:hypothetical protein
MSSYLLLAISFAKSYLTTFDSDFPGGSYVHDQAFVFAKGYNVTRWRNFT